MNLNRLKWVTAILVIAFLLGFDYVRHFVWPDLLHTTLGYLGSLTAIVGAVLLFNRAIFGLLDRMQRNLAQQTNYLNFLIESSGNAIITLDREGQVRTWNHAAETIYGWSRAEAIGRIIPMVPPDLRNEAFGWMRKMWQGETMLNVETLRLRKDGEIIPVMVTSSPIRDADGKIVRILGISTDLRERKQLERELVAQQRATAVLHERERLARELHDDLGQVMGYVNTQSQAIRQLVAKGQTDLADTYLKRLIEVAQDAHADVREYILSLQTNISADQRFVPALRDYVRRFGQNSGIRIEVVAPDESQAPDMDPGTEAQLMRIVQEALTNVRKHAHATQVSVRLNTTGDEVEVEIVDDGKGFDPSAFTDNDGRHFGQHIMRERAAEIGGRVDVWSAPAKGTRLTIRVPARAVAEVVQR